MAECTSPRASRPPATPPRSPCRGSGSAGISGGCTQAAAPGQRGSRSHGTCAGSRGGSCGGGEVGSCGGAVTEMDGPRAGFIEAGSAPAPAERGYGLKYTRRETAHLPGSSASRAGEEDVTARPRWMQGSSTRSRCSVARVLHPVLPAGAGHRAGQCWRLLHTSRRAQPREGALGPLPASRAWPPPPAASSSCAPRAGAPRSAPQRAGSWRAARASL